MQTKGSKKLNGIRGSNFEIRLEYTKDFIAVHLPTIDKVTSGTIKEMKFMLDDWTNFFRLVGYDGLYAVVGINSKQIRRLASIVGFIEVGVSNGATVFKYTGDR